MQLLKKKITSDLLKISPPTNIMFVAQKAPIFTNLIDIVVNK